jgi:phage terminase large subunit-like protein
VIDAILSEQAGGQWAALEAAIILSRQNGKTMNIILPIVLADLFLFGAQLIAWTAHRFVTAQEAFRALQNVITSNPSLSKRLKRISAANGEEEIELHGGSRVKFLARSKTGGRGLTGNRIVLDEAFALEPSHMGSLVPTLATKRDAQIIYGSSAGLKQSEILRSIRDRGRRGGDPTLAYIEWCAPEGGCVEDDCDHRLDADGCALDDRENWVRANPALVRGRITEKFIAAERRALPPEEFGRERLGWWDDPIDATVVPLESWAECADPTSAPKSRPVFAIDVAPGSRSASIAACMLREDGLPHLEVVAHAPDVAWVASRARELLAHSPREFVLDPAGPAGALLPDLYGVGIEPRQLTSRDLGQACEAFAASVAEHSLRHLADPVLARAIAGAGRRDIGDGLWAWSRRKSEADIAPLVAATEALWGLATVEEEKTPPPPPVMESLDSKDRDEGDLLTMGF